MTTAQSIPVGPLPGETWCLLQIQWGSSAAAQVKAVPDQLISMTGSCNTKISSGIHQIGWKATSKPGDPGLSPPHSSWELSAQPLSSEPSLLFPCKRLPAIGISQDSARPIREVGAAFQRDARAPFPWSPQGGPQHHPDLMMSQGAPAHHPDLVAQGQRV